MINKKFLALLEFLILIVAIFSFSYFIGFRINEDSNYEEFVDRVFGKGMVAAQLFQDLRSFIPNIGNFASQILGNLRDVTGGKASVCIEERNTGQKCSVYPTKECDDVCIPGGCHEVADLESGGVSGMPDECKLGTCMDKDEGICEANAPKVLCDPELGDWFEEPEGNVPECLRGCCIFGSEAIFGTERQCVKKSEELGLIFPSDAIVFDPALNSESSCLYSVKEELEGACTFDLEDGTKDCRFVTNLECDSKGGSFEGEGILCSNNNLNTICEGQMSTSCVEGLDEVYWFDSCGNKENIYEGSSEDDKERSWNDGVKKNKGDSCYIGELGDWTKNQGTCGNCEYLLGSICGEKTDEQNLDDEAQDVVCRDLGCYEVDGTRRENGESWCEYQSAIGIPIDVAGIGAINYLTGFSLPGGLNAHSMDPPGSRHFRVGCSNGELTKLEQCDNFRNGICIEAREEDELGNEISQAACRLNEWAVCLDSNPQSSGEGIAQLAEVAQSMLKCEAEPDCFVGSVNIDDFKFPICLPKYAPGFELGDDGSGGENICNYASQTCTTVWVYESDAFTFGATAKWVCKANCDCVEGDDPNSAQPSRKFVEQMNNICVSLGDCGAKANYKGILGTGGYELKRCDYEGQPKENGCGENRERASSSPPTPYFHSEPISGKYIDAKKYTNREDSESVNGGGIPGPSGIPSVSTPNIIGPSLALGGTTAGIATAAQLGVFGTVPTQVPVKLTSSVAGVPAAEQFSTQTVNVISPTGQAFQAGALGAGIGIAVTSILVSISGIGTGVGTFGSIAYMGAGAVSGAAIGVAYFSSQTTTSWIASNIPWLGPAGIALAVVAIADIVTQWIIGVGEIRTLEVTFECKPWQPPFGGANCDLCNEDENEGLGVNFPCSRYSCESLGATCKLVGTEPDVVCVDVSPNDVSGPIISPFEDGLSEGFEYRAVSERGFEIRRTEGEECISQFESVQFGIELNEYAVCKIGKERDADFEEMSDFGDLGNYKIKHNHLFNAIGEEYTRGEISDVELHIKCKDAGGRENSGNFVVNICVSPDDFTAPLLRSGETAYLPFESEESEILIRSNEPLEARWGTEDVNFDLLENNLECLESSIGWECTAKVPIEEDITRICVKGKDKSENGNVNQECLWITINKSSSELKVEVLSPKEGFEIISGDAVSVELKAESSGGKDGNAICKYEIDNTGEDLFFDTGGKVHLQVFNRMTAGNHVIKVRCSDGAGNVVTKSVSFGLKKDFEAPQITRAFQESGNLILITDEPGECAFVTRPLEGRVNSCNFLFEDGKLMSILPGSGGTRHSTLFESEKEYFVKCKDIFENKIASNKCNIIVAVGSYEV